MTEIRYSVTQKKILCGLVLLGSMVRAIYLLWYHPPNAVIESDMWIQFKAAEAEAQGDPDPKRTLWHGLLTHLMALVLKSTGGSYHFVWFHLAASVLTLALVGYLSYRFLPPKLGLIVTGFQAFDYIQISMAGFLMGETLACFFYTACIAVLGAWYRKRSWSLLVLAGLLMGLAAMSREYILLGSPLIALWIVRVCSDSRLLKRFGYVLVLAVTCFLTILPHARINYVLAGKAALGTTRGTRYLAYCWGQSFVQMSLDDGSFWQAPIYNPGPLIWVHRDRALEMHLAPTLDDSYWKKVLRNRIQRDPEIILRKAHHPLLVWVKAPWPSANSSLNLFYNGVYLFLVFPVYLLQLRAGFSKERPFVTLLNLSVLSLFGAAFLGHGHAHYRICFQPIFLLLAGHGYSNLKATGKTALFALTVGLSSILLCRSLGPPPTPRSDVATVALKGDTLTLNGGAFLSVGEETGKLTEQLGPPIAEWSTEGYEHALHYRLGSESLRVDLDREGKIENFSLFQELESTGFYPPAETTRWRSAPKD